MPAITHIGCIPALNLTSILEVFVGAFLAFVFGFILQKRILRSQREQSELGARIAMFPIRAEVYDAIAKFLAGVAGSGTTNEEGLARLLRNTKHSKFLFPEETQIEEYIEGLYSKGLELESLWNAADRDHTDAGLQRQRVMDEVEKLRPWFREQSEKLDRILGPYLRIES